MLKVKDMTRIVESSEMTISAYIIDAKDKGYDS